MNKRWKYTEEDWDTIRMAIWLFILIIIIAIGITGCDLTRHVQKEQSNTTANAKVDSGQVSKNEKETKEREEWWKTTMTILLNNNGKRDTSIVNVYPPDVNVPGAPPAQVIITKEGGTRNTEHKESNSDSIWMARLNSITEAIKTKDKDSETNVMPWDRIIAIGVVILLVLVVLLWYVDKRMATVKTLVESIKNKP